MNQINETFSKAYSVQEFKTEAGWTWDKNRDYSFDNPVYVDLSKASRGKHTAKEYAIAFAICDMVQVLRTCTFRRGAILDPIDYKLQPSGKDKSPAFPYNHKGYFTAEDVLAAPISIVGTEPMGYGARPNEHEVVEVPLSTFFGNTYRLINNKTGEIDQIAPKMLRFILKRLRDAFVPDIANREAEAAAAKERADRAAAERRAEEERRAAERAQRAADREAAAARREERAEIRREQEELDAALESGDEERINAAREVMAQRYERQIDAVLGQAREAQDAAVAAAEGLKEAEVNPVDRYSFILGWLASNVDYLYAKLPGWDRSAEYAFCRRFPEAQRAEPRAPGYSITPADKKTSTGHEWQLANEYHVHFAPQAIKNAPSFVIEYLESFRSRKTGESSAVKTDMSSNALAVYLALELDFIFGKTSDSEAVRTCRMHAVNMESFEQGLNWAVDKRKGKVSRKLRTPAEKPTFADEMSAELDDTFGLAFPDVEPVTASDYDEYPVDDKEIVYV